MSIHLGGLLPHASHHPRVEEPIEGQRRDREEPESPVDDEGVDEQGDWRTDGGRGFDGRVRDDRVYVVGVVLDGLAHGPRVRGCEPGEGCGGEDTHHARAHDVPETHVREVSDGQRDEIDPVSKAKGNGQPHEQRHHLSAVRGNARSRSSQQYLPKLDEDDVGGDRERTVEEPEHSGDHHGPTDRGGQFLEGALARQMRSARVFHARSVAMRVTWGRGSGVLAFVGVVHWWSPSQACLAPIGVSVMSWSAQAEANSPS